jgi:N-acetylglucosamine malate deacetylase 1
MASLATPSPPDSEFEKKLKSILCYISQLSPRKEVHNLFSFFADVFPSRADLREQIGSPARHFGLMIGVRYGEPFIMREVAAVDDVVATAVCSI